MHLQIKESLSWRFWVQASPVNRDFPNYIKLVRNLNQYAVLFVERNRQKY